MREKRRPAQPDSRRFSNQGPFATSRRAGPWRGPARRFALPPGDPVAAQEGRVFVQDLRDPGLELGAGLPPVEPLTGEPDLGGDGGARKPPLGHEFRRPDRPLAPRKRCHFRQTFVGCCPLLPTPAHSCPLLPTPAHSCPLLPTPAGPPRFKSILECDYGQPRRSERPPCQTATRRTPSTRSSPRPPPPEGSDRMRTPAPSSHAASGLGRRLSLFMGAHENPPLPSQLASPSAVGLYPSRVIVHRGNALSSNSVATADTVDDRHLVMPSAGPSPPASPGAGGSPPRPSATPSGLRPSGPAPPVGRSAGAAPRPRARSGPRR